MPAPSPSQLTAEFVPLSESGATRLLARTHGLDVQHIDRLVTERDDTFRVRTPRGLVVAKFAHPLDDIAVVRDQVTALAALALHHPALPVQRVVPARDGSLLTEVFDESSAPRLLRVLTYRDGELLGVRARPLSAMRSLAAVHAQFAAALASIGDTARPTLQGATTPWNLLHFEQYAPLLDAISDDNLRSEAAHVIDRVQTTVLDTLRGLPTLLAHNDMHGDNVLVAHSPTTGGDSASASARAQAPFVVTGILDFGDMTRTPRVADLAVAASYARGRVQAGGEPWAAARAYVAGYESVHPLTVDEHALLPELVLLRLAQRAILNSAIAAANPTASGYASRNMSAIARDLRELGAGIPATIGALE